MTTRMGKRERERKRRQRDAEVERDAGMLPTTGPIADLVSRIGAELDRCIVAGLEAPEAAATLHALGAEAFLTVGSIRGLRAVCQKASAAGHGQPQVRHDLLSFVWAGLGDDRGIWKHRGVE